ncbi:unnamed protein product, partial [Urochloa humidicola]
ALEFKEFEVYQATRATSRAVCGEVDGFWYAFSPRFRKYKNGDQPARSVVEASARPLGCRRRCATSLLPQSTAAGAAGRCAGGKISAGEGHSEADLLDKYAEGGGGDGEPDGEASRI